MKIETRKGLWVSSSFTEKFGNKDIIPAKTVPPFKTFKKSMIDTEIKEELGIGDSTLEDIAAFLENPPEGTDNDYWNIFYVAGCVVNVHWNSDDRQWHVYAWKLDGNYWRADHRAFGCISSKEISTYGQL